MSQRSIFLAALEIADPLRRSAYLDEACAGDARGRQQIEELIAAEGKLGSFLNRPHLDVEATTDRKLSERPGTQIGPYKLREQIGEGGFGIVYVAEQEKPVRRKVALKIIKPGMDTRDVIARFEAERQALALMDHPNVARVLDAGATESGRPYFVMELVQGVSITEFCDRNKLPTRERLLLFADVCRAVQHAHQKGIIHRDLKPSNVMVTLHDGKPVAKVIDFGVSKALSQQLTEKSIYTAYGQMIGTPSYMSPEQAEMSGLGIDTRSDIYSLGVLLYELLTGTTPLDSKRLRASAYAEILRIIREEEPQRPSLKISTLGEQATVIAGHRHTDPAQLRRELSGELDWIVLKCLEKDRGRRYETASALARDVDRYLHDELVEARPPSARYRLQKFTRRNRVAVFVTLFVAASILAILFNEVVGQFKIRRERDRAVAAEQQAIEERDRAEAARVAEAEQRKDAEVARNRSAAAEWAAENEKNNAVATREELRHTLYAAEINLVQAAVEKKDYRRAAQLINQQRPADGQSDLRGFEWHYWQRTLDRGHPRSVNAPMLGSVFIRPFGSRQFTRDAARVVAVQDSPPVNNDALGGMGLLTVVDAKTGRQLLAPFDPLPDLPDGRSRFLHFTMSENGTRIAVAYLRSIRDASQKPSQISLRDGETGQEVHRIESAGLTMTLALSADGSRLAAEYIEPTDALDSLQAAVQIWDTSSGELIQTLPKLPYEWGYEDGIVMSPDGMRLLRHSISKEKIDNKTYYRDLFQVVEVTTRQIVWHREFPPRTFPQRAWSWSPGSKLVVIFEVAEPDIGGSHTVQLWNSETGATLAILHRDELTPRITSNLAFSRDRKLLAVVGGDNEIYIWDVSHVAPTAGDGPIRIVTPNVTLQTTGATIQAIAFSADGRELHGVAGTSIVTWDVIRRDEAGQGPDWLEASSFRSAISADMAKVALNAAGTAQTCLVWDSVKNQELFRISGGGAAFSKPNFSADGRLVVFNRNKNTLADPEMELIICDVSTGAPIRTIKPTLERQTTRSLSANLVFRPDGRHVAAAIRITTQDARLMAWDVTTGEQVFSADLPPNNSEVQYSLDGESLIGPSSVGLDRSIVFYSAATGQPERSISLPAKMSLSSVDERHQVYGGSVEFDFVLFDLATGQERLRLPGFGDVRTFVINPDGTRIVLVHRSSRTFTNQSPLTLVSMKSGRRLLTLSHAGYLDSLAFSPDGIRLLGTFWLNGPGNIKPIQIWDATPLQEEVTAK